MEITTVGAPVAPAKVPFAPFTIRIDKEVEARNLAKVLCNHEELLDAGVSASSLKKLKAHFKKMANMPAALDNYN